MGTNAQPAGGPDPAADATKPLEDAAKALGVLLTYCVIADPSGESCNVVTEMLKGLGAVKQRLVEGPPPPPPAPVNSNPTPFDQAGMDMMAADQPPDGMPPGGPPPGMPPGLLG